MADSRAQAYAQQLALLTDRARALTPEARTRIVKLLEEANREIRRATTQRGCRR